MSALRGIASFLAGVGTGLVDRRDTEEKKARQAKLDAQNAELHTARMADIAAAQAERDRQLKNRESDAVAFSEPALMQSTIEGVGPAQEQVATGRITNWNEKDTSVVPDTQVNKVGNKYLYTPEDATKELEAQKLLTPAQRLAANQAATGRVSDAMATTAAELQRTRNEILWEQQQDEFAKKVKSEGLIETAEAAVAGDAQRIFDAFNKQGKIKFDSVPTLTKRTIDLPGFGKVDSWDIEGTTTGPNGEKVPFKKNSHDIAMAIMPYKQRLEVQNKGVETTSKADLRIAQAENQLLRTQNAMTLSAARAQATNGIDPKPIYDYFSKATNGVDANGQPMPFDPNLQLMLTNTAMQQKGAAENPQGATLAVHSAWNKALSIANGDQAKAREIFMSTQRATAPNTGVAPGADGGSKQDASAKPTPKIAKPMQTIVSDKYPHAGYETVQGVIDGASRGDTKAIAYIKQIANSGLPIQQRKQIESILLGK